VVSDIVAVGVPEARERGLKPEAQGSHNPLVVGSSPTGPTVSTFQGAGFRAATIMKHLHIARNNGPAFDGLYEPIIADSGQGDTFRSDAPSDPGRFLHIFELFLASDRRLVLVVSTLEDWNDLYREGQEFATFAEMEAFLLNFDPASHLPPAAAADATVRRRVAARYEDRRDRFLKQARRRFSS
jgi:hypothetical protein